MIYINKINVISLDKPLYIKIELNNNTKHKGLFNGVHLQIDQGVLSKLSTE